MEMLIGYVFLSVVVGLLGRKTFIGFWGCFIFSLFLSPVIPLIYVLLTGAGKQTAKIPDKTPGNNDH
jgi:hypothetical protein